MKLRAYLTLIALLAANNSAYAADNVCLGSSWGKLTTQQKTKFLTEFRANGGVGNPSSCIPSRSEAAASKRKPQPRKASVCVAYCASDQAIITGLCGVTAIFVPAVGPACAALSPVYSPACKASCESKYGPVPKS